jgi:hypothetical protein
MVAPDNQQGLLLTASQTLELACVSAAAERFHMPQASCVATASSSASLASLPKAAFDVVVSLAGSVGHHDVAKLGLLLNLLRPGGRLTVEESAVRSNRIHPSLCAAGPSVPLLATQTCRPMMQLLMQHESLCRARPRQTCRRASCSAASQRSPPRSPPSSWALLQAPSQYASSFPCSPILLLHADALAFTPQLWHPSSAFRCTLLKPRKTMGHAASAR